MPRTDDRPVRFSMPGHTRISWLAVVAAAALLAGCAATPAAQPAIPPSQSTPSVSASGSKNAPEQTQQSTEPSSSQIETSAKPIDTSAWKSFESFGIEFKHPAGWKVVTKDQCPTCEVSDDPTKNPFAVWDINDATGRNVAVFAANISADTDGNQNTYGRTKLDEAKLATNIKGPTMFIFEHAVVTPAEGKATQRVQLMMLDAADAKTRDEMPLLSYFTSKPKFASQLESTDGFLESLGINAKDVDLRKAKKIMETPEYQQLRTLMLSVHTTR